MFLGYTDDSGRFDKKTQTYQVLSIVLVHDKVSETVEHSIGHCVQDVVPEDRLDKFEEFHAWELYGGYGVFDGVDQQKRFEAIKRLLSIISDFKIPVIYGGVNLSLLQQQYYPSANPIDIAFRMCIPRIEELMKGKQRNAGSEFTLLIIDEMDKDKRSRLKQTFRELRKPIRPPNWHPGTWYIHDDMYFGSSKDSLGIQLADLCSYFIAKHLESDSASSGFYDIFRDLIVCEEVGPK
jgi:hypothetical protein